ncbi:carboxylate--amine ligase [Prodigiosinella confusarubida]|uniref:Carboxylate--amine ligase n=1 Tax=Serratia sp. (strain ATCC 39006) TaxID=104623 RepID=A0A2I5T603_SERS3|nr:ATP-grasp domain-containing protein [Serratia sp. ATCC 39006]AUG99985.1 carboxylate--amine ligase [Serratia sp. ATCC 39006]AUH04305.1 carboxylate--amine ligase [Serratia sp. ATCC 39006]
MSEKKVVFFVEPSFFGVSFVKEAHNLGCYVVVLVSADTNPLLYGYDGEYDDLLVCDIRDTQSIYNVIRTSKYNKIDALLAATDYAAATTAGAAERLHIPCMSVETAMMARNKDLARVRYGEHHVPSAKFKIVSTFSEALDAAETIGYPVVLKPTNTASSQNVFFINGQEQLHDAFAVIENFTTSYMGFSVRKEYLIEEYLDGPEFSVEIFLVKGNVVFAEVTEKVTSPLPYFVEMFHIFPTSVLEDKKSHMIGITRQALESIGFTSGPAHVEVKYTKTGPRIVEVNGRPGGDNITSDLIPGAYQINIFRQAVRNALEQPVTFTVDNPASCAVGYICAPRDGIFVSIENLAFVLQDPVVIRSVINVKPGDCVTVPKSSDDRLGYIIIKMDTPAQAKAKIIELVSSLNVILQD